MVYFLVSPETLEHHTPPGPGVAISLASVMYNNNSDDDVSLVRLGYSVIVYVPVSRVACDFFQRSVFYCMVFLYSVPCDVLGHYYTMWYSITVRHGNL